MKESDLHKKAVRLAEGGFVEIDNLVIRAIRISDYFTPCDACEMDCLCKGDIADVCDELEALTGRKFYLDLASKN